MPRKPGQAIDETLVEQAKALARIGHMTQKQMAAQIGVSVPTLKRYIDRPDQTPAVVAARDKEYESFVNQAWRILNRFMDMLEASTLDDDGKLRKDISPKDLAWVSGVVFDKILTVKANRGQPVAAPTVNFNFTEINARTQLPDRTITDSDEVSYIECEVSSIDSGTGVGEDVLGLPGSSEDHDGVSGD